MSFLDGDIELGDVAAGQTLAAGGHSARHTEVKDALEEIRDGWPTKADQADLDAALVGEGNVPVPSAAGQVLTSTGTSLGDHEWGEPPTTSGLLSALPDTADLGSRYLATDVLLEFAWNGTEWQVSRDLNVRSVVDFGVTNVDGDSAANTVATQAAFDALGAGDFDVLTFPFMVPIEGTIEFPFCNTKNVRGRVSQGRNTGLRMVGAANVPIIRIAHMNTHTIGWSDMAFEYATQRTGADDACDVVQFANDDGVNGSQGIYRMTWDRLFVRGAFGGWAIDRNEAGQLAVWDHMWRDIFLSKIVSNLFYLKSGTNVGKPNLLWNNIRCFNTKGTQAAPATESIGQPAFDLQGCEATIDKIDIENWKNKLARLSSYTKPVLARAWHIEHFVIDGTSTRVVEVDLGHASFQGINFRTEWNADTANAFMFRLNQGARVDLRSFHYETFEDPVPAGKLRLFSAAADATSLTFDKNGISDGSGGGLNWPYNPSDTTTKSKHAGGGMTAADASGVNSGDVTTDAVINNLRTRVNELESKLSSQGIIP